MAQMAQVGTSRASGTGRSGSPELRGTSGTRTRGSSDRRRSVQLNLSTCAKVGLQGRGAFIKGGPEPSKQIIQKVLFPIGRFHS